MNLPRLKFPVVSQPAFRNLQRLLPGLGLIAACLPSAMQAQAPTTAVNSTSATQTATVTLPAGGTLGLINVLTQGAASKDFNVVTGGTCTSGDVYGTNATCTVKYSFKPSRPGLRLGAVSLNNSTNTAVIGTALLYGIGTGPLATFPGSVSVNVVGNGLPSGLPSGVAVDGSGDVFVANNDDNTVNEIVASGGVVTSSSTIITVGSGFSNPYSVAVDGSGDVFVADYTHNEVKEIVAVNGVVTSSSTVNVVGSSSNFSEPSGVAVDGSGDVFVGDYGHNEVKEIVAVNGVVTSSSTVNVVGSGFDGPSGVAVDASGDVFVADYLHSAVKEIVASSGVVTSSSTVITVGSGFSYPAGVAVDASGDVFVTDDDHNAVEEIVAVSGAVSSTSTVNTLGGSYSYPESVAVDGSGHVFVADSNNEEVKEIDLTAAPAQTFASTAVGATSSDSPRSVTVQNEGNAALTFSSLATGSASYPVSGAETCSTSTTLAESATCTVEASFTPQSVSATSGTFTLTDNTLNVSGSTQTVALSGPTTRGAVTFGTMSFSPAATEPLGTSQAITISETVTYGGVQPTGAVRFVLNSATYTATCTSGGSPETCSYTVSAAIIAALSENTYTVTASLSADANYISTPGNSGTFTITAPVSVYTAPTTAVDSTSATQTAYVTFPSGGTLGTINVLTQGAMNQDFNKVTGGTCSTGTVYASNAFCTVLYSFKPSRPGQRLGAISANNSTNTGVIGTSLLIGTGTGPLATFPGSTSVSDLDTFGEPVGVAVDGSGDVFVVDDSYNAVYEIVASSGVVTSGSTVITVGSGFNHPQGLAVDGSGDVFVADYFNSAVKEIVAVNGVVSTSSTVTTVGSGFFTPAGVAVDGSGDVFVADTGGGYGNDVVYEIVAVNGVVNSGSTVKSVGSGFGAPAGVAVDGSGDVFVANEGGVVNEIVAVNGVVSSGSTVITVGSGFSYPFGVAVDASGDVFVADANNRSVKEIVAVNGVVSSTSTVYSLGGSYTYPYGVAVDGSGHVFVVDFQAQVADEIDLTAAPAQTFASTAVGATSSDSPHSVTVQNEGNAALTFTSLATGSTSFPVSGAETCGTSTTLVESATCKVEASFTPQSVATPLTGTFTLTDNTLNASGSTQTVALSGDSTVAIATFGTMSFSPASTELQGASQAITISDTLTYGGPQPSGAVTFVLNSVTYTASCTSGGSPETCTYTVPAATIAALPGNIYTVTASLAADSNYNLTPGTSGTFTINAFAALTVSGFSSPAVLSESGTVTVTAKYTNGSTDTAFTGTVTLTSSDAHASLPAAYTFQGSDHGVHVFTVTLNTVGTQSITATDGSISGSQTGIVAGDAIWALNAAGTLVKVNESGTGVLGGAVGSSGTTSPSAVSRSTAPATPGA